MKRRVVIALAICVGIVVAISGVAGGVLTKPAASAQPRPTATTRAPTSTVTPGATRTPTTSATPGWVTILDDQFNTPGVPSHWSLYNGSYGDSAHNCAAPSQVQVPGDGYLHLKMQYLSSGLCGAGWYTGGMQVSPAYGGVDQTVTVRWRIVPSADPNAVHSHRIIPMRWVDDPQYPWYRGESNYCEGSALGGCYTFLHYGPNGTQVTHGYDVDLTQWHTWRVVVRGHKISVFIDNMTSPVWVYQGNETTMPNSVKRTTLQQECPLSGCPSAAFKNDVEDIEIDWITIQNATSVNPPTSSGHGATTSTQTGQNDQTSMSVSLAGAVHVLGIIGTITSVIVAVLVRDIPSTLTIWRRRGDAPRRCFEAEARTLCCRFAHGASPAVYPT